MRWDAFAQAAPRIAAMAEERFRKDELAMLGTIRPDGSPRITPNELDFAAGRLLVSMMWQSRKAQDLLRDPRIAIHSLPSDKTNPGGDIKLYGRAIDEPDPDVRRAFHDEILRRIDWAPEEPNFHLFSLDVEQAGYIRFGDDRLAMAWDPERGEREIRHPDAED
ncbi:MAG TPA: pyridoxamine 5'-phosphate oxidase family protein [Actinomycetota bacterium]|nr:pyridoxamine 5'-phosphate oxidase family protein [Actinomycetota bacterium]